MERKGISDHLKPISAVAVIGAGPAGLAAARRLLENGINATIFERKCQAGGTWVFDDRKPLRPKLPIPSRDCAASKIPRSGSFPDLESNESDPTPGACYESLMNNIITPLMTFSQYSYPPDTGWFVTHDVILKYLQGFSRDTGSDRLTKYNSCVSKVHKMSDGKWSVMSREARQDHQSRQTTTTTDKHLFDAVVVCTGHYDKPFVPPLPGLDEWVLQWPEQISHSKEYRNNTGLRDKTVLIIGAGNSAYDIGREIASVAKTVYLSVRSKGDDDVLRTETPWEKVVRSIIPDNLFQVPEISAFCSTRKLHRLQDAQVLLANDARLSGIEFIIFCTGYRYSLPFLPDYQAVHTQKVEDQTKIISDGEQLHNLHKDMIFIEDPTLTFIGVSKEIATFSFFDMQAVAIAAVFAGQVSLPSKQQMRDEYDQRLRDFAMSMTFHQLGLEREIKYIREIVQWVNGSTSPRKLIGYEQTLHEAQQKQLQALRELLISTEILRGKSLEEKQRVIAEKTTQLQQAIAMAD